MCGSGGLLKLILHSPPSSCPSGFGFVWFDDPRDAEDAVKDLDNRELLGKRMRM